MSEVLGSARAAFERDGYLVVPGALSPDEVAALRDGASAVVDERGLHHGNGKVLPDAAVQAPELHWAFGLPKVLEAVRVVLGEERPVFTFEADVHRNLVNGVWHKDTGERVLDGGYFACDAIGRDDCRVVKVALYLQDHSTGGGLRVRPGSHATSALDEGDEVVVPTAAGDAVLFDVRLTHRGQPGSPVDYAIAGAARLVPADRRGRVIDRSRRALLRRRRRPDRLAVYFAYGVPGERTEVFARRNMGRQRAQLDAAAVPVPALLRAGLDEAGVDLVAL